MDQHRRLEPVHLRHVHVHQHDVEIAFPVVSAQLDRLRAPLGEVDVREPAAPEKPSHDLAVEPVIVDDENLERLVRRRVGGGDPPSEVVDFVAPPAIVRHRRVRRGDRGARGRVAIGRILLAPVRVRPRSRGERRSALRRVASTLQPRRGRSDLRRADPRRERLENRLQMRREHGLDDVLVLHVLKDRGPLRGVGVVLARRRRLAFVFSISAAASPRRRLGHAAVMPQHEKLRAEAAAGVIDDDARALAARLLRRPRRASIREVKQHEVDVIVVAVPGPAAAVPSAGARLASFEKASQLLRPASLSRVDPEVPQQR
eukprot:31270-Pelagococcus_subviridis.AAC.32